MGNILRGCRCCEDDDPYVVYAPRSQPRHPRPRYCGHYEHDDGEPAAAASSSSSSSSSGSEPEPPTSPPPPPGRSPRGVAALERDLLHFEATSMVPNGLGEYVISSRKAQVKWYRNMLEAYNKTKCPPATSAEAAKLVSNALSRIQRPNLQGVLAFYGFTTPTSPAVISKHNPSLLHDVQRVLNTLPVNAKCIGDGDGFTAYVDTTDPMESKEVPLEVREAVTAMAQARKCGNNQNIKVLQKRLRKAGYRIIVTSKDEILAKQYRIRLRYALQLNINRIHRCEMHDLFLVNRGIDAPEIGMDYGEESQNALVKLISGKSVKVYVYGQDQYKRYVGDVYCDGVFIQEQMLKKGHVWHYKAYDARPEFARWEKKAQVARYGLWADDNPEKPWEWRKRNCDAKRHVA